MQKFLELNDNADRYNISKLVETVRGNFITLKVYIKEVMLKKLIGFTKLEPLTFLILTSLFLLRTYNSINAHLKLFLGAPSGSLSHVLIVSHSCFTTQSASYLWTLYVIEHYIPLSLLWYFSRSVWQNKLFGFFSIVLLAAFLRYNSYPIKFIHFKCIIQWSISIFRIVQPSLQSNFRMYPSPQKTNLVPIYSHPWSPRPRPRQPLIFLDILCKWIISYVVFGIWLFSLSIVFLRFIHVVACIIFFVA